MSWFTDYLSNRRQSTKFGSAVSEPMANELGLPQGSVLSAILFILFINDIKANLNRCKINLFADDTTIYLVGRDVNEMIELMNQELEKLSGWLNVNKLKLNANKTKYMVIGHVKVGRLNPLKIDDCEIERTSEVKYLGCFIDEKLNFNANCNQLRVQKVS